MNLKCGYFTVGGIMCGSLVGIFVGALAVNASLGYMTVAQTDPRVPEIVTEEPQAVYLYNSVSRSGKPLNYTKTKNPLAGGHWDRALVAAEGDALAADLERYIGKRSGE